MGDDPFVPDLTSEAGARGGGSAATGGNNYTINNDHGLSKGGQLFVVITSCLAIGLAVGAVIITAMNGREADRAEREARMLQYYVLEMDAKLIAAGFKTDAESVAKRLKENTP